MGQPKRAPVVTRSAMTSTMESGVRHRPGGRLPILLHPEPSLSRPSYDVDPCDPKTVELAAILIGAMKSRRGCLGLSAPQLGRNDRLFCFDVTGHRAADSCAGLVVLTNPEILAVSGERTMREGCASIAYQTGDVTRASQVVISGLIPGLGRRMIVRADAIEARSILHALDHLDGILFVDRIRNLGRDLHQEEDCG